MAAAARRSGSRVAVASVPTAIQVCRAHQLLYYPHYVDLLNARRFDLGLPQRITRDVARANGLDFWDLRPALRDAGRCPYQPRNRHWTQAGHEAVAGHLGGRVAALAAQLGR